MVLSGDFAPVAIAKAERTTTGGLPVPMAIAQGKIEAIASIANLSDD
ncbi:MULTISPECIES: hypothetical protein [unclassified Microcoleus]